MQRYYDLQKWGKITNKNEKVEQFPEYNHNYVICLAFILLCVRKSVIKKLLPNTWNALFAYGKIWWDMVKFGSVTRLSFVFRLKIFHSLLFTVTESCPLCYVFAMCWPHKGVVTWAYGYSFLIILLHNV